MADQDIKDFDPVTPGNNTTVWGTSIAEGATQTNQINDMGRQILSTVARANFGTLPVLADTINESTLDAGVTIDGLLIKDGSFSLADLTLAGDLVAENVTANVAVATDVIQEKTAAAGIELGNDTTAKNNLQVDGQGYSPIQTLTDGASISWDLNNGNTAKVTLAGNRTLAAPTNMQDGGTYILRVVQDATGSRTLTFNAVYRFPNSIAPTLSTGANAVDYFYFVSDGTNMDGVPAYNFG